MYNIIPIITYIFALNNLNMSLENTQAQMRKGILEFCILSIIEKKEVYPSEILEQLKGAKLIVVEGTLYPLLTRLKNLELLAYRWEESNSGPPRKYFHLTPTGKVFLKELKKTWIELNGAISLIIEKK